MAHKGPDDLMSFLRARGIEAGLHRHPAVHTVEESCALRGDIPGIHTKNLFVRDGKKRFFLLVMPEDYKVNLKAISGRIGARGGLSFATPEALEQKLGIRPGSVSLFALINDVSGEVTLMIDASLRTASTINGHPLTNEATICVSPAGVETFLEAVGHAPQWIEFAPNEV